MCDVLIVYGKHFSLKFTDNWNKKKHEKKLICRISYGN